MTVDECFAPWPPVYRDIYGALADFMSTLGAVHADTVKVGVFLKRQRKLAEIRPKARCLSLDVVLPRRVDDPRIARTIPVSGDRFAHLVKLTKVEDVDDQVRAWLAEAYTAAG
ncbi:DUF5655 domain-containing protein [Phytohabitans rumicis]|nr:DUF5655 domain-containing protein [Phytohabitans rumicis]